LIKTEIFHDGRQVFRIFNLTALSFIAGAWFRSFNECEPWNRLFKAIFLDRILHKLQLKFNLSEVGFLLNW